MKCAWEGDTYFNVFGSKILPEL